MCRVNERRCKVDRTFPIVEWDGFHFGAVLTYWSQRDTLACTVWRLVMMDRGQTLVVEPYQTADAPAPDMHLPPERIVSILAAGDFGWTVGRVATACSAIECDLHERPYDTWSFQSKERLKAKLEREFPEWRPSFEQYAEWYKKQKLPQTKHFNDLREKLHENPEAEDILTEIDAVRDSDAYKREQERIVSKRLEIEEQGLEGITKAKAKWEKETKAERLEELREMLAGYGVKIIKAETLKELYDFIRNDVCSGNRLNPAIGESALRRVVAKVKELTGADIAERVMESIPFVKAEMFNDAARQSILERVRFIAEFADGRKWLVEKIEGCIHCGRDAELFELVKPDEQEREDHERQIQEMRKAKEDERREWFRSETNKRGERFWIKNEYRCIVDIETGERYQLNDATMAHKALRAFAENTTPENPLRAEQIKDLIPNSSGHGNSPSHWFRDGISPAEPFKNSVYPALIQSNNKGLWWIDLDGRKSP